VTEQFLLGEVSRRPKMPAHRIIYLYITGKLPEPDLRLGNCRVFAESDVLGLAMAVAMNPTLDLRQSGHQAGLEPPAPHHHRYNGPFCGFARGFRELP
jgi:hypothetical protein